MFVSMCTIKYKTIKICSKDVYSFCYIQTSKTIEEVFKKFLIKIHNAIHCFNKIKTMYTIIILSYTLFPTSNSNNSYIYEI